MSASLLPIPHAQAAESTTAYIDGRDFPSLLDVRPGSRHLYSIPETVLLVYKHTYIEVQESRLR
jgi:hypothetical protein